MEERRHNRPWEKEGAVPCNSRTNVHLTLRVQANCAESFNFLCKWRTRRGNGSVSQRPLFLSVPSGHTRALQASPSASGELRIFPACFIQSPKGKTSTRSLAGMNSKHKYIHKFRAGRRGEYLPVIGKEKLGGPRAINHICAVFVRFIAWTRWHFQDFRR